MMITGRKFDLCPPPPPGGSRRTPPPPPTTKLQSSPKSITSNRH